jgi:hypothetical protein
LCLKGEHFFEAFYHGAIIGFLYSAVVYIIESGEYITAGIRPSRKLDEERGEQIVELLFIDVAEVKIKIGDRCLSSAAQFNDILYDRRTESMMSVSQRRNKPKDEPDDAFPRARYKNTRRSEIVA